jgi:hypothetical protein
MVLILDVGALAVPNQGRSRQSQMAPRSGRNQRLKHAAKIGIAGSIGEFQRAIKRPQARAQRWGRRSPGGLDLGGEGGTFNS